MPQTELKEKIADYKRRAQNKSLPESAVKVLNKKIEEMEAELKTGNPNLVSGVTKPFTPGQGSKITKADKQAEIEKRKKKKEKKLAKGSNPYDSFDIESLDPLERRWYNDHIKHSSKEEVLHIIMNSVEGDTSQMSPGLAKLAKKVYGKAPKKEMKKAFGKEFMESKDKGSLKTYPSNVAKKNAAQNLVEVLTDIGIDMEDEEESGMATLRMEISDHEEDSDKVLRLIASYEKADLPSISDKKAALSIKKAFTDFRAVIGVKKETVKLAAKKAQRVSKPAVAAPAPKKSSSECDEIIAEARRRAKKAKVSAKKTEAKPDITKKTEAVSGLADSIYNSWKEGGLDDNQVHFLVSKMKDEADSLKSRIKARKI